MVMVAIKVKFVFLVIDITFLLLNWSMLYIYIEKIFCGYYMIFIVMLPIIFTYFSCQYTIDRLMDNYMAYLYTDHDNG